MRKGRSNSVEYGAATADAGVEQVVAMRFGIRDAAVLLGISRAQLYVRIQQGAIRVHKDGARTFVSRAELERYVRACEHS